MFPPRFHERFRLKPPLIAASSARFHIPVCASMAACALDLLYLGGKPKVETDRGIDFFHDDVRSAREPAAPHFVAHRLALFKDQCPHDRTCFQKGSRARHSRTIDCGRAWALIGAGVVLYGIKAPGGRKRCAPACPGAARRRRGSTAGTWRDRGLEHRVTA